MDVLFPKIGEIIGADQADFSEEKLKAANIIKHFKNEDRECCLKEVLSYIEHEL